MAAFFYLMAIFYFFSRFSKILDPSSDIKEVARFSDKEFFSKADSKAKGEGCVWALKNFIFFIWCVIGIAFSNVWEAFALLMLVGIFSGLFKKILGREREKTLEIVLKVVQHSISSVILLYIFFSYFHPEASRYIESLI
jgi:hypothetical protein